MILLNGKKLSQEVLNKLKLKISLDENKPLLGMIIVGNREDSVLYVKKKKEACEFVGINSQIIELKNNITEEDLILEIEKMNNNPKLNGILVQLPLPKHINEKKIILSIRPDKDVDGLHPVNIGNLVLNRENTIISCTPKACFHILKENNICVEGKHCVMIGCSNIVGKPLSLLLLNKNATISICHIKTKNIKEITIKADILLVACGQPNLVKNDWIKKDCIIIDVGTNYIPDKTKKSGKKLIGDVDFNDVKDKVKAITPVPGGVGPMTVAMLLENTYILFKKIKS